MQTLYILNIPIEQSENHIVLSAQPSTIIWAFTGPIMPDNFQLVYIPFWSCFNSFIAFNKGFTEVLPPIQKQYMTVLPLYAWEPENDMIFMVALLYFEVCPCFCFRYVLIFGRTLYQTLSGFSVISVEYLNSIRNGMHYLFL